MYFNVYFFLGLIFFFDVFVNILKDFAFCVVGEGFSPTAKVFFELIKCQEHGYSDIIIIIPPMIELEAVKY